MSRKYEFLHFSYIIIHSVRLRNVRPEKCSSWCSLRWDLVIWYKNRGRNMDYFNIYSACVLKRCLEGQTMKNGMFKGFAKISNKSFDIWPNCDAHFQRRSCDWLANFGLPFTPAYHSISTNFYVSVNSAHADAFFDRNQRLSYLKLWINQ